MSHACLKKFVAGVALATVAFPALGRADSAANISANLQVVGPTRTLEGYVPTTPDGLRITSIEMRPSASISGGTGEVTFRQICRWSEADNELLAPVADLVVARLAPGSAFATVEVEQIQQALADAGMASGSLNFSGSLHCTISRSDVRVDEGEALRRWVAGANPAQPTSPGQRPPQTAVATAIRTPTTHDPIPTSPVPALTTPVSPPAAGSPIAQRDRTQPVQDQQLASERAAASSTPAMPTAAVTPIAVQPVASAPVAPSEPAAVTSESAGDLRAVLIRDIAARTHVPVTRLQVDFAAEDRALLSLTAPVKFTVQPQRYGDLGETSWFITVDAGDNNPRRIRVRAIARAWIDQLVLTRNVNLKEEIGASDIQSQNVLADRLAPDQVASADAVIGKQAIRDLRAGTVLTGRMIAPLELVKAGQAVTITMRRGAIQIRSVATALQAGSLGQSVRVRNPQTNDVYQVQLTGPQTGIVPGSDPIVADAAN